MTTQLMCIVTAAYAGTDQPVLAARPQLDRLFEDVGCVHFAAFALLPPAPEGTQTTLILELAVDPDIAPEELLDRLLQHGLGALLAVYGCCLDVPERASQLVLQDRLREFLRPQLQRADGGFVGQRDRTVGQIRAEGELYEAARKWLHRNRRSHEDRGDLAIRISEWAIRQPQWAWAASPAPRSFLRSPKLGLPLRGLLLLARADAPLPVPLPGTALFAVVLLIVVALAFLGILALLPFAMVVPFGTLVASPQVFGSSAAWGPPVVAVTLLAAAFAFACYFLMILTARLVTVAAFFMLVVGTVLAVALAVFVAVLLANDRGDALSGIFWAAEVLVRTGVLALVAFAALWALVGAVWLAAALLAPPFLGTAGVVGLAVVLSTLAAWAIHLGLAALVHHGSANGAGLYGDLAKTAWWGVPALDVIVVLEFLGFTVLTGYLTRVIRLPPFARFELASRLDRIDPRRTLAWGHQVHQKVVECEAELAQGRVSHMFSLTEVRDTVAVNRWLLRYFLRLVTLVGHTVFTEGKLAHAEGIRFAHWYLIDGKRLLFCSNFDGGFGGYLDEFINGASEGINLFWRWTELRERKAAAAGHPPVAHDRKFPPTRLGVFRGCKYEQWFKTYARDSMLPHLYRYEAYRYTAADVQRATRLREALFGARTQVNDDQLLRALES